MTYGYRFKSSEVFYSRWGFETLEEARKELTSSIKIFFNKDL